MNIILLGAPGSGKGTQADFIGKSLNIPKISTGEILRLAIASQTPLGVQVKDIMQTGRLVSDDIILTLVKQRIAQPDCRDGFLLDGTPRTVAQAKMLWQANIDFDYVIELQVSDAEIIKRLTGRLVHVQSGRIYHSEFNPPKIAGIDDHSGEPLQQRHDDELHIVEERLRIYHAETAPLTTWYRSEKYPGKAKYLQVPSLQEPAAISANILKFIA